VNHPGEHTKRIDRLTVDAEAAIYLSTATLEHRLHQGWSDVRGVFAKEGRKAHLHAPSRTVRQEAQIFGLASQPEAGR
jgi:hypothetical protein